MKSDKFNQDIVSDAFHRSLLVLNMKELEYATIEDRLDNFKVASEQSGKNPIEELIGMASKHWTSLVQMSRDPHRFSKKTWLEKTTDLRNYTILLEGLLADLEVK